MRTAFGRRDKRGTGTVSVSHFQAALKANGIRLGSTEFQRVVARHSGPGSNSVKYNDFLREYLGGGSASPAWGSGTGNGFSTTAAF